MSMTLLPAVPAPPDDPTSLLLDRRLGWSVLDATAVTIAGGALSLERFPGSLRWLVEPSGSFGGLRTPANVAVGPDGSIWLLDRTTFELKRFDPCGCRFDLVPCFGGEGGGPRQLLDAGGIAVARDRLYVSDAGNGRVSVFALPSMALRATLVAPMPWLPTGVAVDPAGRVHVVDPQNGAVHRFSWRGRYQGHVLGVGASRHLAIACDSSVYAAGEGGAVRIRTDGVVETVTDPADDLVADFPCPPFEVDADGRMHLGPLCLSPSTLTFDLDGEPSTAPPAPEVARYQRSGVAVVGPLDSQIDGCAWHRIILRGELPTGSRVELDCFTSEVALPESEIAGLREAAWEGRRQCLALEGSQWDGLVTSPKGRYLWVRFHLWGNGGTTPRLESAEIEFPRISLRRYLPAVYGAEPVSADFTDRFLALFDRPLRDLEQQVDQLAAVFDPRATQWLDWLASWVGVSLDHQLPEGMRREMLVQAIASNDLRGTPTGLWRLLVTFFGLDQLLDTCQCVVEPGSCRSPRSTCPPTPPHRWTWQPPPLILEHFKVRRWLELGAGRLGDQAVLWGQRIVNRSQLGEGAQVGGTQLKASQDPLRDPFHVYAHRFTVFAPASVGRTPARRRALQRLIDRETPAHTEARIEYVEARMRIGFQSTVGLDTVVARVPEGVTLGETALGVASVLTGDPSPSFDESRIGTTAVLG